MLRMTMDEIAEFAKDDAAVAAATQRVLRTLEQYETTFPHARETSALVFLAGAGAVERERGRLIERVRALGSGMDARADGGPAGWTRDDSHSPAQYRHPKLSDPITVDVFDAAFPRTTLGELLAAEGEPELSNTGERVGAVVTGGAAAGGKGGKGK